MNKLTYISLFFSPMLFFVFFGKKDVLNAKFFNRENICFEQNSTTFDSLDYYNNGVLQSSLLPTPFTCPANFFHTYTDASGNGNFAVYDLTCGNLNGNFDVINTFGNNINATGYNPVDNYIYTIQKNNFHLLQIQADGSFIDLGALALTVNPVVGGFDPNGLLYVKAGNTSPIDIINVNTLAVTSIDPGVNFNGKDWAYNYQKGKFYGVHNGGGNGILYSYDPATDVVESFPLTGLQAADGPTFGAAFYSSDGYNYVVNNNTGNIYRLEVDANEAHFVVQGAIPDSGSDGAACPNALPPIPVVYANPDTICVETGSSISTLIHDNDETHLIANLNFSTYNLLSPPSFGTATYASGNLTYTPSGTAQSDVLTYEICGTDACGLTVCDYTDVVIIPVPIITFDSFGPYCEGATPDVLPTLSNEGVIGTWSPISISTATSGTNNYTFTPDPSIQCGEPETISVTINTPDDPTFAINNIYCEGENTDPLPTISNNGIAGSWTPSIINNSTSGNYTFTPDANECANIFTLNVTINSADDPTFSINNIYCQGENTDPLPTISNNGIAGSWTPSIINNSTSGNYTFTPDANECANIFTLNVTINTPDDPIFSINNIYCQGENTDLLPNISNNGIAGSWTPSIINNSTSGNYTFTPDANECANIFTLNVTINSADDPIFSINNIYCEGENTDPLPSISNNGITGNWTPSIINNSTSGNYTFVPDATECANIFTLNVTINSADDPTFSINNIYCEGENTDPLPSISNNGISGNWTPNVIDNSSSGNYTFIPNANECANIFTLNVTINSADDPTFSINNIYCEGENTDPLPTISNNGIAGSWTPSIINNSTSGNYTFIPDATECANIFTLNVTINTPDDPIFSINNIYCQGENTDPLPTISNNGIAGSWTPSVINNSTSGNYTFTPDATECANIFTLNVTINSADDPTFFINNIYCEGENTDLLPNISNNGIAGSWTPSVINNSTSGNYTFIPNATECANIFTLNVTINTPDDPIFSINNIYCEGENTDPLPSISNNGIAGSWTPSIINNSTSGNYTFVPDATECANIFTLNVTINSADDPIFSINNIYCEGENTDPLPSISNNGIAGSWTPSIINNSTSGNYTFVPDATECANIFTLNVTINSADDPTFSINNIYCEGENTDPLPSISNNGISGNWTPNVIDNSSSGNYTFTPDASECANPFILNVIIQQPIDPTFNITNNYCVGDQTELLPNISGNGINGTWTPNVINNNTSDTYVFTPDAGQCANPFSINISISNIAAPTNPINNIFCFGENPNEISVDAPSSGFQVNWYDAANTFLSNDNPFTPASAGNYFATYQEISSGCESASVAVVLSENPQIIITQGGFNCSNDLTTYDLEFTISGGSGIYNNVIAGTFNVIDNGGGSYTIQAIPSGTNTIISVIDSENCTTDLQTTPQDCDCPIIASPTNPIDNIFCFGENPNEISVDNPPSGLQVNWYDATNTFLSSDNPFTPPSAGTYFATYQNVSSGCESASLAVTLSENPQIIITQGGFNCSNDLTTYDLEFTISGGSGIYNNVIAGTFNVIDNGGGSYTIQSIPSGTFTNITVTDSENCIADLTTTPQDCDCPLIASPTNPIDNIFCFGENPNEISVDNPPSDLQVNWYDAANTFLSNDNPFTPPSAGTYFATYQNVSSGCESASLAVTLSENPQIIITQGGFNCSNDLTTYDLEFTISGGSEIYNNVIAGTFNVVDNGGGSYTIQGIPSGTATIISIIDSENCTTDLQTTPQDCDCPIIASPTSPIDNTFCFGDNPNEISVDNPPSDLQVNWYDATNTFLSNDNPFTPPSAGSYFATYQEISSGCESASVAVVLSENPQIIITQGGFNCSNDLTTYDLEFTISGGSGIYNNVIAGTFNVVDNGSGSYTIQGVPSGTATIISVIDSENCTTDLQTTPQDCDCPIIASPTSPIDNTFCFGDNPNEISVDNPPSDLQVNWYDATNTFLSNDNPFAPASAGSYFATYQEISSGCESASVAVVLSENPQIIITQGGFNCSNDLTTYDLEFTISGGSGIYNNVIAGTFNVVDNGGGSYTIQGVPSGTATIISVIDSENCTTDLQTTPQDCDCPIIAAPTSPIDNIFCFGDNPNAISVDNPPSGLQVNWYDASNTFLSNDNPFTPASAGTYFATYQEISSGCESASLAVTLAENPPIIITQGGFNCSADLTTYDLDFTITGGTGSYNNLIAGTFNIIDNGGGSYTIQGIPSGTFTNITVTDSENCIADLTTTPQDCDCPMIAQPTNPINNIFCFGENPNAISVEDAPIGFQVNWYDATNTFLVNDNPFTPTSAGTYFATYQEILSGCESASVEVVLEISTLTANAGNDQTISCQNPTAILSGSGSDINNYSWVSNNGFNSTSQNPVVTEAGIYTLTITNSAGCTATDEVEIIEDNLTPLASASVNQSIDCQNSCVTLIGSSSATNSTFTWSGPDPDMDINAENPEVCVAGTYELSVSINGTSCVSPIATVVVQEDMNNLDVEISITQIGCENEDVGSISIPTVNGGLPPYLYSIDNGNTFGTSPVFENLGAGNYEIVVQDAGECEYFETVTISNLPTLEVFLEPLAEIELGENYQINTQLNISPQQIDTLWWNTTDSLDCSDCLNPIANPTYSTTYQINVIDENGCTDEAQIQIIVNRELRVFVPNAFSPNGDGSNDIFTIYADQGVREIEKLQIFDRWGELVFSNNNFPPNDAQFGWDGKLQGKEMNNNVFVFFAKIRMEDGRTELIEGDLTITK